MKFIAVQSAVVFANQQVAFNVYTESLQQNLFSSDVRRSGHMNLSRGLISAKARVMPMGTRVAFSREHLERADADYKNDVLIPCDEYLKQRLDNYAHEQLAKIITVLKTQQISDDEAIIRQGNPLSEYADNTDTLELNERQLAVQSTVVFSDKTVAFNVYTESREQNLFRSDTVERSHVNLSRDLINGLALHPSESVRTRISFTNEHLKKYDSLIASDTLIPIDEMLSKHLCQYAVNQLGHIMKSQYHVTSTYGLDD